MRKKKLLAGLLIGAAFLSGACSAHSEEAESGFTATSAPEIEAALTEKTNETKEEGSAETEPSLKAADETAAPAENTTVPTEENPAEAKPAQKYIDENGLLNDAAKERIDAILAENETGTCSVYPGLFDFDRDGVPELYLVFHNGGQGYMPTAAYTLDGDRLGEFAGYCRDGFCRFSYGEDCVYVHNKYEHSMHTSCELVTRLTVEDGVLSAEDILHKDGDVGDSFPLKNYTYFVNGESAEKDAYYESYNRWLHTETVYARDANEVSLCIYDLRYPGSIDDSERAETVVSLYNQYITGKNAATEQFGSEPLVFAFDDYDEDGTYEAFVQPKRENGYPTVWLYFWNGTEFTELDPSPFLSFDGFHFTRIGDLLFVQPFGNGRLCSIFGVRDGKCYEHENSLYGMLIRTWEDFPFESCVNEEFVLYDSTYELHHTSKPYFFTYPCVEIVAEPVTEADFSDREDVLAALEELKAELSVYPENAEIVGMYLRGGEYLHVNYNEPIETHDEEGNTYYFPLPHYRTYMVQNKVTQIDEGDGHYKEKLCGE